MTRPTKKPETTPIALGFVSLEGHPHCHPGHDAVLDALVEYIETELGMRDPRRLLKRRAIG